MIILVSKAFYMPILLNDLAFHVNNNIKEDIHTCQIIILKIRKAYMQEKV